VHVAITQENGIKMSNQIEICFRVRARVKGGPCGGKILSHMAPEFELDSFMKTPNAAEFVRKAYLSAVKKIIRDIAEDKNGTAAKDLSSTEAVVARSLAFTKDDISDWLTTRDWTRVREVKNMTKLMSTLMDALPSLATRRNPFEEKIAKRLADVVIAAVADQSDPVADFLFTVLTQPYESEESDFLGF
jgi:hypothetical protein